VSRYPDNGAAIQIAALCVVFGCQQLVYERHIHTLEASQYHPDPAPPVAIGSNYGGTATAGPVPLSSAVMRWPDDRG
jgi:hypothetical protein